MVKERAIRYLSPAKEQHGQQRVSPLDTILNGVLDLGIIDKPYAKQLRDDITHHYADFLYAQDASTVGGTLGRIASFVNQELSRDEGLPVTISYQKFNSTNPDKDIEQILDDENKRLIVMDGDKSYLVAGYERSERNKLQLEVRDPRKPKRKPELKRHRWVTEVLSPGAVVVEKIIVEMAPGEDYVI